MRRALLATALLAAGLAGCGDTGPTADERSAAPPQHVTAPQTELPPLPTDRQAKVVEPVAGDGGASQPSAPEQQVQAPPTNAPAPTTAASAGATNLSRPDTAGDGVHQATALPNGIALPPLEAPEAVRRMIEAGNVIARSPYVWGGGHGKWVDKGYDCSGSVSFVLASAGYLTSPLASGPLMSWGEPGPGKWVTIYANDGHVWMTVAGIRFDTSGQRVTGSRWQNEMRSTAGFALRHPPGL